MADTSLNLSDEEFMNQDPAAFLAEPEGAEEAVDPEIESVDEPTEDMPPQGDSEAQEEPEFETEEEEVGDLDGDTQTEHEPFSEGEELESLDTSDEDSTDTEDDNPETTEFDYESAYKKVTKPFKANGAEMTVTDPDDIISLMQMGANYQKKMATMKPNLKMIKMLENAGLLDESKLNNLIDISKKDPKAVAKLIEESGIDPLDIDTADKSDYQPTDYSVSDKEYNLDQVLDGIKDTSTFSRTIDVLTKEWDTGSKSIISDNPEIISIINLHMENGVYDKVNAVMQQEKMLGKLAGVPDVKAYKTIAESMHQQGLLSQKNDSKGGSAKVSSETDDQSQANAERTKKRKAVAPVKQSKSVTKSEDSEDFLGLSDDEFMKKFAATG
tara:strand:+ start:1248 stop:2399 length:1152 start_codon:yes stop_codon:yes gene_type:complete